jgi:hypothetical protein
VPLPARQPLPPRWFGTYGLALVRRGVIVRQRIDASGAATAVDVVGAGCALPLDRAEGAAGYTASDAIVCLCPKSLLDATLDLEVARDCLRLQTAALERMERLADARARGTATAKVAALLVAIADTLAPPRRLALIPSALQQRDLGALLAMRHESVCRALRRLERDGVVARRPDGLELLQRAPAESAPLERATG